MWLLSKQSSKLASHLNILLWPLVKLLRHVDVLFPTWRAVQTHRKYNEAISENQNLLEGNIGNSHGCPTTNPNLHLPLSWKIAVSTHHSHPNLWALSLALRENYTLIPINPISIYIIPSNVYYTSLLIDEYLLFDH